MINKIYNGDALNILKSFPNDVIDCVVTSPPYYALRDYGIKGQLGLEKTFHEYLDKLIEIFAEVKRVLKPTGTCFVNLGDSYYNTSIQNANDGRAGFENTTEYNYTHSIGNGKCLICGKPTEKQFCSKKCLNKKGNNFRSQNRLLPSKCLLNIPSRFAIRMTDELGFIQRNEIIWYKRNCMPSSAKDRFTVDFEKVYFFTKNKKYYFEAIKENAKDWGTRDRTNGKYKKVGLANGLKGRSAEYGRNKRCVWDITTKPYKESHFAVFPEDLVKPMIQAGCPINGIVLDLFAGSGTTLKVAKDMRRNYIGIELNPNYIPLINKRLGLEKLRLAL